MAPQYTYSKSRYLFVKQLMVNKIITRTKMIIFFKKKIHSRLTKKFKGQIEKSKKIRD